MIWELSTIVGTQNVWKQQRYIVHDTTYQGWRFYTDLHGDVNNPLAVYAAGELYADVTDYLRTYPTVSTLYFADNNDPSLITSINVKFAGLIDPSNVIIPPHDLDAADAKITPPAKIVHTMAHDDPTDCEFYATSGTWSVTGSASLSVDGRHVGQIDGSFAIQDTNSHKRTYTLTPMTCGVLYALVRWVSFSGVTRESWFEVTKCKTAIQGAYSLLPIDNEYINIKGREDGFVLRLDGLCAYDLWYYADVITSSKVEISLDGGTTYDRVQVSTKEFTLPDGEMSDGKLEINVNWKRYDAVAM